MHKNYGLYDFRKWNLYEMYLLSCMCQVYIYSVDRQQLSSAMQLIWDSLTLTQ